MSVYFATLAQTKAEIDTASSTDDAIIMQDIAWASARIANLLRKRGVEAEPVVAVRRYDAQRGAVLALEAALVEYTTLTLGDGRIPTESDYLLSPHVVPYSSIEVYNGYSFASYSNIPRGAIALTGVWGWHQHYGAAWAVVTTLAISISDSADSFAVASAIALSVGQLLRVGSEYMRITAIDVNTLTVRRGVNGSIASAHDDGTSVDVWVCDDLIVRATVRAASYLFKRRGAFETTTYDGLTGVQFPADLPKEVENILFEIPNYAPLWYAV